MDRSLAAHQIDGVGRAVAQGAVGDDVAAVHVVRRDLRVVVVTRRVDALQARRRVLRHHAAGVFDDGVVDKHFRTFLRGHDAAPESAEGIGGGALVFGHCQADRILGRALAVEAAVDDELYRRVAGTDAVVVEYDGDAFFNGEALALGHCEVMAADGNRRAGFPCAVHGVVCRDFFSAARRSYRGVGRVVVIAASRKG